MAFTGEAFGVALGINAAICLAVFLFFGLLRRAPFAEKFFCPRLYARDRNRRPPPLPRSLWGWISATWGIQQDDVVALAGYDAAMFLRVLAFGAELFIFVTLWTCIVVLPTNLSGHQVKSLIGRSAAEPSNFTYWIPPPPPPSAPGTPPSAPSAPPRPIKAPQFYESVPPAPPGLEWWHYRADVPPLPEPAKFLHDRRYKDWGWRYDPSFQISDYTFSNLDLTTMTNISSGDQRLWVHLLSCWVISLFVWRMLWRYNKEAVALRIAFFTSARPGGEAHTVLVRDIPGLPYGTIAARIEDTVLRFLPKFIKRRIVEGATRAQAAVSKAVDTALDLPLRATPADASVHGPPVQGIVSGGDASSPDKPPQLMRSALPAADATEGRGRGGGEGGYNAAAPLSPGQVVTEVDAWDQAVRGLLSGLTPEQMVERQFEGVFPGRVLRVRLGVDTRAIDGLIREYWRTRQKAVDLLDEYESLRQRRRSVKRRKISVTGSHFGSWGLERFGGHQKKVDALQFYVERMQELVRQIRAARERLRDEPESALPAAFVTFRTRTAQAVASTSMLHHDRSAWLCKAAPEPRDVIWGNLGWRAWERQLRAVGCWAVFFVMVAFYLPVVTAIQALLQLDRIVDAPALRWLFALPGVAPLLAGFLPQLVLRVFLALLPTILALLGRAEGLSAESEVEFTVVKRYYAFQVVTVFFATFIAGSFLNQINQFINAPASVVRILGAAAPQTAAFFINYLLLLGLTSKPILFLRLPALVMFWIETKLSSTERAKARLWRRQYIDYGYEIPDHATALLLGLTFCVISPLIAPVALIYFLVNTVMGKYQLVYVYAQRFQSGGRVWRAVSGEIFFAVFCFQLVMLGLLTLKGVPVITLLALPLPILTAVLWRGSESLFGPPQEGLSLEAAAALDRRDQEQGRSLGDMRGVDLYVPPAFRVSGKEAAALAAEAAALEQGRDPPTQVGGDGAFDVEGGAGDGEDDLFGESEEEAEEFSDAAEELQPSSSGALSDAELPLSTPLLAQQQGQNRRSGGSS